MGNLQEELLRRGLASEKQLRIVQAEKEVAVINEIEKKLSKQFVCMADLESCETVNAFKQAAKKILLADWDMIGEVLIKAHEFRVEGSNKLIGFCYRVRDGLTVTPSDKRNKFLKRAFRRAGATTEIPEDWLR